jgi:CO/xanthine dehydrogenase FAD-binding subunit
MKPAPFQYCRPANLDEACAILAVDENARIIAGGQSLVPMMAMRLVRPSQLVDIARIPGLSYVREDGDHIAIGAATRQCTVAGNTLVRAQVPLLAAVLPWVGHAATRARGTIGGSIAQADPAAEIVLAAITLGAQLVYRAAGASLEMPAADFFTGLMTTALPIGGCLVAVHFPRAGRQRVGVGFNEVSARRSDFAFASAAAQIALNDDGTCRTLAIGIGAITEMPFRLREVEAAFVGSTIEQGTLRGAIGEALSAVAAMSDLHATPEYRRRAAASLAVRAVMDAVASARSGERHVH